MGDSQPNTPQPSIEDYATIEGYCDGSPIYSFGGAASVYGVGPGPMPGRGEKRKASKRSWKRCAPWAECS